VLADAFLVRALMFVSRLTGGGAYNLTGHFDNTIADYRKVLEIEPEAENHGSLEITLP
jgi:hypothetical protein